MQSAVRSEAQDLPQRARFDWLKRRIFAEMFRGAARWRLAWVVPFQTAVAALLVARGLPTVRSVVVGAAVLVTAIVYTIAAIRPRRERDFSGLAVGAVCFFAILAATGGLASPMLVSGALFIVGIAFGDTQPRWVRFLAFVLFSSGFVALALASRTAIGDLPPPLAAASGQATTDYVVITAGSVLFVAMGAFRMGCHVTRAYQQVALELAERREELCTENEDRTRALEGIAARLAHEVKNPLAAIKGLSTHMARSATDPKTAERLSIVAAEADRLQAIVEGFLSFSRGFDDLKVGPTNPHELARELVLLLETRATETGVSLSVGGDTEVVVNADARKLRQALLNLVLNAMQASPVGKGVRIEVARSCEVLRMKVIDQGAGMTPEVLDRIRKPYFTTKEGGSGLGVAVARGIIEQHGGQLTFDSAPGRGTTVTIELPHQAKCKLGALPNPLRKEAAAAQPSKATA